MNKIVFGTLAGIVLGLLDGASAFLIPEAADMMTEILIGSTVKGLLNGFLVSLLVAKFKSYTMIGIVGAIIGLLLSVLAAIPSGTYLQIIVPGVIIGFLLGILVKKWGK